MSAHSVNNSMDELARWLIQHAARQAPPDLSERLRIRYCFALKSTS
jgi:hypothetical protein